MRPFEYVQPTSLQEATGFLERHQDEALALAGGTALVLLLAQGLLRPRYVVDLAGLPELLGLSLTSPPSHPHPFGLAPSAALRTGQGRPNLPPRGGRDSPSSPPLTGESERRGEMQSGASAGRNVLGSSQQSLTQPMGTKGDGGLRLGALTRVRALERDPTVRARYPLLAEAASQVAGVRIRNVATVGGSVCYGEPQTDLPPALIALGARAMVAGPTGQRTVPLEGFFSGPYQTVLQPGELLIEVVLPAQPSASGGCHLKFTVGSPENKPVANVSVALSLDSQGRCASVRIVLGAVGPAPGLATQAMELLEGQPPDDKLMAEAARRAAEQADPVDDLRGSAWYKRRIVRVLTERAVRCAWQRAQGFSYPPAADAITE